MYDRNRKWKDDYIEEHWGKGTTQELTSLIVSEQNEMSSFNLT